MDKAKCELSGWRWECPRCGNWNDEALPVEVGMCSECWTNIELTYDTLEE